MRMRSVSIGALAVLGAIGSGQRIAVLVRHARARKSDPAYKCGRLPDEPVTTVSADDLDREQLQQLHAATLRRRIHVLN
jgi:hypothetical protein